MRSGRVSVGTLQKRAGRRYVTSSSSPSFSLPSPLPAVTVRSKGYGPTKDLLKGVDTSRRLVVETDLHPADAEMQRRVLSLSAANVGVCTPLGGGEAGHVDSAGTFQPDGIVAVSPEQLASVATVIVDQIKQQLELSDYIAEATQDGRSSSVVNAVANCLREEMERLFIGIETQEVSFSRLLSENSDAICARIADVIQTERSSSTAKRTKDENAFRSSLLKEMSSAFANLEKSLKVTLDASLSADENNKKSVFEEIRVHIVEAIEQASRMQQEYLTSSIHDVLGQNLSTPEKTVDLEAIQCIVDNAMTRVVEQTQHEVQEVLKAIKSKKRDPAPPSDIAPHSTTASVKELDVEGLLTSYGDRLDELRETTAGFTDLKELIMEVHSLQQTNEKAVQEVRNSVRQLKKELLASLHELSPDVSTEARVDDKRELLAEYSEKLSDLADRVTTAVEQQLKEKNLDVKELLKRLHDLENVVREKQRPVLPSISPVQELDDDRMITLAQSISDSILASLPSREALTPPPPSAPPPPLPQQLPSITREDILEAVSAVIGPKLEELAAQVAKMQAKQPSKIIVPHTGDGATGLDEHQFITLAQTIAESVKDAVRDAAATVVPAREASEPSEVQEKDQAVLLEHLVNLKESIIATVQEEMGQTHEVDLTPFRSYLDEVLGGVQEALSKQQEETKERLENVYESLLERLQQQQQQQQVLLEEHKGQQRSDEGSVKPLAFTREELATLNKLLLGEMETIVARESKSLLSSIKASQEEIRDTLGDLPKVVEKKLSSLENSVHDAHMTGESQHTRLHTALKEIKTDVETVRDGNDKTGQVLRSINNAVSHLAQTSATSSDEIKAQLTARENRTEAWYTQMSSDFSERFGRLQAEVKDGKQRIEELLSSSIEYKSVASSVNAMRLRLEEVSRLLDNMKSPHNIITPPLNKPHEERKEEQPRAVNEKAIELKLENLVASTQEILSELQKYHSAQKLPTPLDTTFAKDTLTEIETRLNERLQGLNDKIDEMMRLDIAGTSQPSEEGEEKRMLAQEQLTVSEDVNQHIKEIDVLIKNLQTDRTAQGKNVREKLIALRSFLISGNHDGMKTSNIKEIIIEALEENRLKLKEDAANTEAALVREVGDTTQQTLERLFSSFEKQTMDFSTKSQMEELQSTLNTNSEKLETQQERMTFILQDRFNKFENLQETQTVKITKELQSGHKEWKDTLNRVVQEEMPKALQGVVAEICTEQLRSVRNQLDERETREEKSAATLLSSVREVSHGVSQLGGLSTEVRAAVTKGSTTIIEELQRTQERLADRFERHVASMVQKIPAKLESPFVSYSSPAAGASIATTTTFVPSSSSLSLWWLCVLSFVVFSTIMLCAYFLFAAFLVAVVPVPPPEELLTNIASQSPNLNGRDDVVKRHSSSRVVDHVME